MASHSACVVMSVLHDPVVSGLDASLPCPGGHILYAIGAGVGLAVGACVGAAVGAGVGGLVGPWVGALVGAGLGALVGAWVGTPVGAVVGALVVALRQCWSGPGSVMHTQSQPLVPPHFSVEAKLLLNINIGKPVVLASRKHPGGRFGADSRGPYV